MKDDNDLDQGFIEEDGAEQEHINSKMIKIDGKEEGILNEIDKDDVKMIESSKEVENNSLSLKIDNSRLEKLSNLIFKEKAALEKPHVVIKKFGISELNENLKKLYKRSEVIKSKKKKKSGNQNVNH